MKKQLFIALALIFTASTQIMSRNITITNNSSSPIMLLPLFVYQKGYEIINNKSGRSEKTYRLGANTIFKVSWTTAGSTNKCVATINMGPIGSDKDFTIGDNCLYTFGNKKGDAVHQFFQAKVEKLSKTEMGYLSK